MDNDELIYQYELTRLSLFPSLNERLICVIRLGGNVDPMKSLSFNRPMLLAYSVMIDILAASEGAERERILDAYFR